MEVAQIAPHLGRVMCNIVLYLRELARKTPYSTDLRVRRSSNPPRFKNERLQAEMAKPHLTYTLAHVVLRGDFMDQGQRFLSVKSVAQRYGLTERTIYQEITAKRIPAVKIGDPGSKRPTLRIPIDGLEKWEADQLAGDKK